MQTNDHPPYRVQEVRGLKERRKRKRGKNKEEEKKKKKKKTWHTTRAPESRLSGQFAPIKPNAAPRSGLEGKQAMATIGEDASRHGKPAIFTFHNYPFPSLSLSSKRSSSSECVVARPPPFGTILFCSPRDCPADNYCLFSGHHSKLLEDFRNFQPLFRFSRCLVFFPVSLFFPHDLFTLASVFSAFTGVVSFVASFVLRFSFFLLSRGGCWRCERRRRITRSKGEIVCFYISSFSL